MRKLSAQGLVEYGLLVALVVVIVAAALLVFGSTLTAMFGTINTKITSAVNAAV
jgi:Flp pilus assembly pilin Flp